MPHFIVPGDAAATAQTIMSAPFLYRTVILGGLLNNILFIPLALYLYRLLKTADRTQARLMVAFVLVAVALGLANQVAEFAPLILLGKAWWLGTFTQPQRETLAMLFLRLRASGLNLAAAYWGLWLLPFGVLVVKSRFIPRILGHCLIAGFVAWAITSLTFIMWPASGSLVSRIAIPFYAIGEIPIATWLLVRGGAVPLPDERA
jgi:hypothetical protein